MISERPMKVIIRRASLEDLSGLAQLFNQYRIFYKQPSDLTACWQFLSERLESGEAVIFVAEENEGGLIGYTQLFPLFSSVRLKRMWLLNDLYVMQSRRGQGISKLLIDATKQLAIDTNACGLLLDTAKSNTIGNKLYPAVDFKLEESTNYYFWTNNATN